MTTSPGFSNRAVPARERVLLAAVLTLLVVPILPPMPTGIDPFSAQGTAIVVEQFLIGAAIGLTLRLIITGLEMAGELIGSTMGLGFAVSFDPQSAGRTTVISQFLGILGLLFWFVSDLHLVLLEVLVESFRSMPIGGETLTAEFGQAFARQGSVIFSVAVQISLPVVTMLLLANLALGILTRAAPQLNIFGVGFPITITLGFVGVFLSIPIWMQPIIGALRMGTEMARQLVGG